MREFYTFADLQNWREVSSETEAPIRLGIFGDPVAHSLSPQMQNAALRASGLAMQYARFRIAPDELRAALRLLPRLGFIGVNLTIPHKVAGGEIVDELNGFARTVGCVNTVRVDGDKLIGFNTDGPGFSRAIRSEFSADLRDLRVLLFGAGGGAGRAIAMQCATEGCRRLVLVNRTLSKAQQLAAELLPLFSEAGRFGTLPNLEVVPWEARASGVEIANSDLVVNATPLGMDAADSDVVASSLLRRNLMVYDTVYVPARTQLLIAAAEAGARGANGLSMLLQQGALAFETWFGRAAPFAEMQTAVSFAKG